MVFMHSESIEIKSVKKRTRPKSPYQPPRKHIVIGIVAVILCLGLGFGARKLYQRLCQGDFFQIIAVKIDGNHMTSKEQITVLSRVDIHSNLLAIDVEQVRSLLESHPWIAAAEIIRDWPNRLLISIREKNPVALLTRESGLFYLDSEGRIIAAAGPGQELDFPVITGLEKFPFAAPGSDAPPPPLAVALDLLKLANRNNPILPQQNISEIHVADNGGLVLYLLEKPFPIYLGTEGKISTRYYRLVKVLKDLYKTREFSEVTYIRLDYQEDAILVGKHEPSEKNGSGSSDA